MNSFDVFDTLIARRTVTTRYVWQQLEKEFNIPAFASQRPIPDDGTKTFLEVYQALVSSGVISADLLQPLMDRELALEIEHSYPIQENMDRVNDGDMLISDMYLPASAILQMVRAAGLNRQVTIYQSNADKGKGIVWKELMSSPPALHLGDNQVTDFQQPQTYGIRSELYSG
jgi:predicted HAD superfamily hydrolase